MNRLGTTLGLCISLCLAATLAASVDEEIVVSHGNFVQTTTDVAASTWTLFGPLGGLERAIAAGDDRWVYGAGFSLSRLDRSTGTVSGSGEAADGVALDRAGRIHVVTAQ